jgi:hypothetical protein
MNFIEQKITRKNKLLQKKKKVWNNSLKKIHEEKMKHFEDLQTTILDKKRKELEKATDSCTKELLKKEIYNIVNREEEITYYFNAIKLVQEYFSLTENDRPEEIKLDSEGLISGESRKTEIIREYYIAIGFPMPEEYKPNLYTNSNNCKFCGGKDTIESHHDGLSCSSCSMVVSDAIITNEEMSYNDKQEHEYTPIIDYKRINYFTESLNQIQAKEHTDIPQELLDTVLIELKKEKIKDISKITNPLLRRLLKKTGYSKYYEHIPYIINNINGLPPIDIPPPIEEKLKCMFNETQDLWVKHKPKDRNNFFSYPYTINKFCELLGLDEYRPYFPLLKSRDKLYKQDIIWKKIMNDLANKPVNPILEGLVWRFIPSV